MFVDVVIDAKPMKTMLASCTQRDNYIDALMRTDALLEYAIRHGMTEEATRLREKLDAISALGEGPSECKPVWNGEN